ncbi:ATP-binding protein [Streptomyces fractus]|uniref:sensor histidine kinase n=1 Tax=Streptomyces fractus TaxID=641806 RepID=UPI003CF4539D
MTESGAGLVVLAGAWAVAGGVQRRRHGVAVTAVLLAVVHLGAALVPALAPLVLYGWLYVALALPDARLGSAPRRIVAGAGAAVALGWSVARLAGDGVALLWAGTVAVAAAGAVAVASRCVRAGPGERRTLQWVGAGVLVAGAGVVLVVTVRLLIGVPHHLAAVLPLVLIAVVAGVAAGGTGAGERGAERAVVEAVVVAGLALLVCGVYVVVVLGLGRAPSNGEREVLAFGVVAAVLVALLALPVRARLVAFAQRLLGRAGPSAHEMLGSFAARMSRAVPFDELLLQLVESLREAMGPGGAEAWVDAGAVPPGTTAAAALTRTVSVPELPPRRLELTDRERAVAGRTRLGGEPWAEMWLPGLLEPDLLPDGSPASAPAGAGTLRVAPATHLGELLGLLVVRRTPLDEPFTEEDERVLVELARQVGLALHNVRLDSALQASLAELQERNAQLQASRLRIVAAADASRRAIERNLHDGAQQHLVALSVKLGLAEHLLGNGTSPSDLMADLRTDVTATITAVRELAHGIYPPLLRNHGLERALLSAARRCALPCTVQVEPPAARYGEEVEAAVYFCCLEAMQNACKHAGGDAEIDVVVAAHPGGLRFTVTDTGQGFAGAEEGAGFVNMTDRLGAVGGTMEVVSAPGRGTSVRGTVPACGR